MFGLDNIEIVTMSFDLIIKANSVGSAYKSSLAWLMQSHFVYF